MAERQVRQSYREALVQISPITKKKRKKETGGHWREWEVNERGKKGKRGVEKDKKRKKLKSFFTNAVSIDYRCIYAIL